MAPGEAWKNQWIVGRMIISQLEYGPVKREWRRKMEDKLKFHYAAKKKQAWLIFAKQNP